MKKGPKIALFSILTFEGCTVPYTNLPAADKKPNNIWLWEGYRKAEKISFRWKSTFLIAFQKMKDLITSLAITLRNKKRGTFRPSQLNVFYSNFYKSSFAKLANSDRSPFSNLICA
ncbi:hypothetical protein A8938_1738 [Algoriphagus zhangzhouensis]|uniref:Uncharacterized protein n=1 Tax=Algoriphagus zhangzhouensis TaxID=1073327 RepID=A0A1M7ZA76_9BACT|nr:hypothetical protein A8938_1738 [Algoriphagus zhangzhouensis]SHO61712.1 hypothetical protein SAMN04488108_1524 [Algoriphagus zhangzhouensis]